MTSSDSRPPQLHQTRKPPKGQHPPKKHWPQQQHRPTAPRHQPTPLPPTHKEGRPVEAREQRGRQQDQEATTPSIPLRETERHHVPPRDKEAARVHQGPMQHKQEAAGQGTQRQQRQRFQPSSQPLNDLKSPLPLSWPLFCATPYSPRSPPIC